MRVALVLYGQPRFLDNPHTLESHRRFLLDRHDTDVFCHTWWDANLAGYDATFVEGQVPPDSDAISKITAGYTPSALAYEPPRKFEFPTEARKAVASKFSADRWNARVENNLASQFYSLEAAANLVNVPTAYDFIVVTRLDVPMASFPSLATLSSRKFYVSDAHPRFPDFIFVFGPQFLASQKIYSRLQNLIADRLDAMPDICGEYIKYASFIDLFDKSNIRPAYMPGIPVRSSSQPPVAATSWLSRKRAQLVLRTRGLRALGRDIPLPPRRQLY